MGYFLKKKKFDMIKSNPPDKKNFPHNFTVMYLYPCVVGLLIRIEWPVITFVQKQEKKVKFLTESFWYIEAKPLFSIFWDLL